MAEERVREEERVWARHGDLDLLARIYRPPEGRTGPLPAIVEVHGGAWSTGDRNGGVVYDRALALAGFVVVAIDFRQGPEFKHPAASADVTAAVRWVRLNAGLLEANAGRIGLAGSSSGGHLAMLAGLKPDAAEHRGVPISAEDGSFAVHDEISAAVNFVIALWPVSDPAARYRYARRARIEGLMKGGEAYFGDEAAMWEASIPRIVTAGEAPVLPPLLVVQPGEDSNIPQEMTFDLLRAYQARGGRVDYAYFPGMPHAFGHRPGEATSEMVAIMTAFARRYSQA
ncbi:MAG: alpha/beta hydrolase [Caulobacteraceae bacterium]